MTQPVRLHEKCAQDCKKSGKSILCGHELVVELTEKPSENLAVLLVSIRNRRRCEREPPLLPRVPCPTLLRQLAFFDHLALCISSQPFTVLAGGQSWAVQQCQSRLQWRLRNGSVSKSQSDPASERATQVETITQNKSGKQITQQASGRASDSSGNDNTEQIWQAKSQSE